LGYVGALSEDDPVILKSGPLRLDQFAARLQEQHQQALEHNQRLPFKKISLRFEGQKESYYSYSAVHWLDKFGRQRLVISYERPDLSDHPVIYISNRLHWQAPGIMRIHSAAGPWKSIMKTRPKGSTSINSGLSN
jgi:hypothetical protein